VSNRELGALYAAWRRADRSGKQRIVAEPLLVIRALPGCLARHRSLGLLIAHPSSFSSPS
jgi:hypothetical protein